MQIEVSDELVALIDEYERLVDNLTADNIQRYTRVQGMISNKMTIALSCARSLEKTTAEFEMKRIECDDVGDNDGFFELTPKVGAASNAVK